MKVTIKFPDGDVEVDAHWLSDDMARVVADVNTEGDTEMVYHLSTGEKVIGHTLSLPSQRSKDAVRSDTVMMRFR